MLKPYLIIIFRKGEEKGRKEGEIKATLSIIDNLLDKGGIDWSFITNS